MKNIKQIAASLVFVLASVPAFSLTSQEFGTKLLDQILSGNTKNQLTTIQRWEKAFPNDADMLLANFSYHAVKGMNLYGESIARVTFQRELPTVPVINASPFVRNDMHIEKAIQYINKAESLHPNRLDVRWSKLALLANLKKYNEYTTLAISTMEHSNKIKSAWIGWFGKPWDDGDELLLSQIPEYIQTLINSKDANAPQMIDQLCAAVLKLDIDLNTGRGSIRASLNNQKMALIFFTAGKYDAALPYLLQIEQETPNATNLLDPIAQTYIAKNDVPNAKLYLAKLMKLGTDEVKLKATQDLAKLSKK